MKRVLLTIMLLLVASRAGAQITITPASAVNGGGAVTTPLLAPVTPTDCSAAQYSFQGDADTGYSYGGATILKVCVDGTVVTTWSIPSGGSATSNFLNVTGTLPVTPTAQQAIGANFRFTTAGSAAFPQEGFRTALLAGYTGSSTTASGTFSNAAAGTNTSGWGTSLTGGGNQALYVLGASAGAGHTVGATIGAAGSSTINLAGHCIATSSISTPALNVGCAGQAVGATNNVAGYFGLNSGDPSLAVTAAIIADNGAVAAPIAVFRDNGTAVTTIGDSGSITQLAGITAAGLTGVPVVVAVGRVTAQSAANASISTFTVGAVDASFEVSANMNVTASTTLSTTLTCTYTDEGNTARSLILPVTGLTGSFIALGAISGAGATVWETPLMHIRAKASTVITILTSAGTFTGVTYTAEGVIKQMK